MVYSLFASSKQPSPNDLQEALSTYIKSPSSKELMTAVEENFFKGSLLTEADGSKLYTIVMTNPFSMIHFLGIEMEYSYTYLQSLKSSPRTSLEVMT